MPSDPAEPTAPWIEMTPGVRRRTLTSGEALMQMVVTFTGGTRLPEHSHPHEQVAFVSAGSMRFTLHGGREERVVRAGESIHLAPHVPHGAEALEDATVIDTFSPPREDLLEQDRAQAATVRV